MLQPVLQKSKSWARPGLDVGIAALATAVPKHRVGQDAAAARARTVFPHLAHLDTAFLNTGIDTRYSCVPVGWYYEDHGWKDRQETFRRHALDLLEETARQAINDAGLDLADISVLVTQTSTGVAVPTLDAMLMNRMAFPAAVERLPLFGLGCAGGVATLARAAQLAQFHADGHVLMLTVELCGLCFRLADRSPRMFIASALFADGAAGLVLRSANGRRAKAAGRLTAPVRILALGEHFWPGSEHIMGWSIENDGFGIVLSIHLPPFLQDNLLPAAEAFLHAHGVSMNDLDGFIFHPGGRRVMEAVESALGLKGDELRHSKSVLRDYGNMSSATVLFVLQRTLQEGAKGLHLMAAFGPGFTASFALVELS